ncbi:murein hydrolase activator EnvC family protein [Flavobacterium sp. '19STA2R22 D10 B1']|uniref:murein hydrolase activator EnvC family protein n=1 Tax=Flavobacterium aerium TaxID=3037261 RepID=UPI00278C157C|nr:peptidoglycan DD-metalloendopeptidase family protein [Flavobacterium sp. '19STA2R22 D10 B1']
MSKYLFSLIFCCITTLLWSQNDQQKKLEERKAQIQKEIQVFQSLLKTEKSKEKSVLTKIGEQNAKIKLTEKLINNTQQQTKLLNNDIYVNQRQINKLTDELELLKKDYAEMIVKSYKSRSEQSRAMFLLSSENFLQAYKRAQYMKQYANYRKMQGDEIKVKSEKLQTYNQKLAVQKGEKEKLIRENEKEKVTLESDKKDQQVLMTAIKKDQKKYNADIKKKQQESVAIDRQIQKLIREAIAAANAAAEAKRKAAALAAAKNKAKGNPTTTTKKNTEVVSEGSSTKFALTAETKALADNFKANKGKLPWPVDKGLLTLGYGDQPHPLQKNLVVHNSGVEITTEDGANARAVFGGEVLTVQVLSGNNKAVYIQHGDYITVYLNLQSVSVSKGDKVSIKQTIGKIHTNSSGKTVIKFLVLQNTTMLNPEQWLFNM